MYCTYPGHFFLLQTINSPCDIFRVFQRVEHESYLLGTKSHLCKKYVFAEAIGVTRHVHTYVHISPQWPYLPIFGQKILDSFVLYLSKAKLF